MKVTVYKSATEKEELEGAVRIECTHAIGLTVYTDPSAGATMKVRLKDFIGFEVTEE